MIAWLKGRVVDRGPARVVLDVNGVGYALHVTLHNAWALGQDVELFVHTHVRDDAIQLFGFKDGDERTFFHLLLGVQGVGPVKAMQILQTPVRDLAAAVAGRETARLAKLPGVGKKTAERIVLDLQDKVADLGGAASVTPQPASPKKGDLASALSNLGFKEARAEEAAGTVLQEHPDTEMSELVRLALARLTRANAEE